MEDKGENKAKYAKLRENATRAERKEATLDDLRRAAAELQKAASKLGAAAEASDRERASIAADAASLAESARILAGEGADPAEYFRDQLQAGIRRAASDVDFRECLELAAGDLVAAARETAETARSASASLRGAYEDTFGKKRQAALSRVIIGGCIVLAVAFGSITSVLLVKLEPVFAGKAVVSYEPAYESELDRTRLELAFAENELDAYRRQYPLGIGETAQADLDAANRAAQEAYDAKHAG